MKQAYIIFLRAVNVSGKNIIRMSDLKQQFLLAGFGEVRTYIQSGNILLESDMESKAIEKKIHHLIREYFSLDVDVFVMTKNVLDKALADNPFPPDAAPNRVFITFLNEFPVTEKVIALGQIDFGKEAYMLKDKILYFHVPDGMATSKMSNSFFEQKLKVKSTGRNLNTIRKILALL